MFENAKLAEQKSEEAQEKEDEILKNYENNINDYLVSSRNNETIVKNLLDERKEYNLTTAWTNINSTIILNDSIENYDVIYFKYCANHTTNGNGYLGEENYLVRSIEYENLANTENSKIILLNKSLMVFGNQTHSYQLAISFQNNKTINVISTETSFNALNKFILLAVYGVKY